MVTTVLLPNRAAPRGAATNALAKRLTTIKATAVCWREREQVKRMVVVVYLSVRESPSRLPLM